MATITETRSNIVSVPQGWTLAAAFSTDMKWIGLPGYLDQLFNITERDDKEHYVGEVTKIDNLYMLFVKESSYNVPIESAVTECLQTLAKKVKKKNIRNLAMPKICCGKNGLNWNDVKEMIIEAFDNIDVNIMICSV